MPKKLQQAIQFGLEIAKKSIPSEYFQLEDKTHFNRALGLANDMISILEGYLELDFLHSPENTDLAQDLQRLTDKKDRLIRTAQAKGTYFSRATKTLIEPLIDQITAAFNVDIISAENDKMSAEDIGYVIIFIHGFLDNLAGDDQKIYGYHNIILPEILKSLENNPRYLKLKCLNPNALNSTSENTESSHEDAFRILEDQSTIQTKAEELTMALQANNFSASLEIFKALDGPFGRNKSIDLTATFGQLIDNQLFVDFLTVLRKLSSFQIAPNVVDRFDLITPVINPSTVINENILHAVRSNILKGTSQESSNRNINDIATTIGDILKANPINLSQLITQLHEIEIILGTAFDRSSRATPIEQAKTVNLNALDFLFQNPATLQILQIYCNSAVLRPLLPCFISRIEGLVPTTHEKPLLDDAVAQKIADIESDNLRTDTRLQVTPSSIYSSVPSANLDIAHQELQGEINFYIEKITDALAKNTQQTQDQQIATVLVCFKAIEEILAKQPSQNFSLVDLKTVIFNPIIQNILLSIPYADDGLNFIPVIAAKLNSLKLFETKDPEKTIKDTVAKQLAVLNGPQFSQYTAEGRASLLELEALERDYTARAAQEENAKLTSVQPKIAQPSAQKPRNNALLAPSPAITPPPSPDIPPSSPQLVKRISHVVIAESLSSQTTSKTNREKALGVNAFRIQAREGLLEYCVAKASNNQTGVNIAKKKLSTITDTHYAALKTEISWKFFRAIWNIILYVCSLGSYSCNVFTNTAQRAAQKTIKSINKIEPPPSSPAPAA